MKFSEMPYVRPDVEAIKQSIASKTEALKKAASFEEAEAIAGGDVIGRAHFAKVMVQKGYVTDDMSSILISVKNKDSNKADSLRADIVKSIDDTLSSHDINAPVINQTLTDDNNHKKFAKDNGISFGKAVFIKNIVGKDSSLDEVALAKMTISELTQLVIDKNIDISDNLLTIGDAAFMLCLNLTSINLPNKVTSIGSQAFLQCLLNFFSNKRRKTTRNTRYGEGK